MGWNSASYWKFKDGVYSVPQRYETNQGTYVAQVNKEWLFNLINLMNLYRHEHYNLKTPKVSNEVYG